MNIKAGDKVRFTRKFCWEKGEEFGEMTGVVEQSYPERPATDSELFKPARASIAWDVEFSDWKSVELQKDLEVL